MWKARAQRTDTTALRRLVRDELELGEDDTLTISEMACPKQGCPPAVSYTHLTLPTKRIV